MVWCVQDYNALFDLYGMVRLIWASYRKLVKGETKKREANRAHTYKHILSIMVKIYIILDIENVNRNGHVGEKQQRKRRRRRKKSESERNSNIAYKQPKIRELFVCDRKIFSIDAYIHT